MTGARLFKSDAFLERNLLATFQQGLSGRANRHLRVEQHYAPAVARLGEKRFPLYGRGPWEASRIDILVNASLIFALDSQIYLLSLLDGAVNEAIHARRNVCDPCGRNRMCIVAALQFAGRG
jgi:hypothetical protein